MTEVPTGSYNLPLEELEARGVDTVVLIRLLERINAPLDCPGLLDAVRLMLSSVRAAQVLTRQPSTLAELTPVLTAVLKNHTLLPPSDPVNEGDAPFGRYKEHPIYSLFAQRRPNFFRNLRFINDLNLIGGFSSIRALLLIQAWISDTPLLSTSPNAAEFLEKLRVIWSSSQSNKILTIIGKAESIQEILDSLASESKNNILVSNVRDLASQVMEQLLVGDSRQRKIPKPSPDENIHDPQSIQKTRDFGNGDKWTAGKRIFTRVVATDRPRPIPIKTVVLRAASANKPGVDSAETGVVAQFTEAPPTPYAGELPNTGLQKAQVLDARYANEFDNQFLPFSWEVLNEFEVATLVASIKTVLEGSSAPANTRIGALTAGLSIVTSRRPEELAAFKLSRSAFEKPTSPTILLDKDCWFSPFPPLDRFKPTAEQSEWLQPVGDGCYLPLPIEFLSALKVLCTEEGTLDEALGYSAAQLELAAKDFCREVRKDAKSRANFPWLRSVMFHRLLDLSADEVGAIATLGDTEHAPTVGLYYATFQQSTWRNVYGHAISKLGLTPSIVGISNATPFGSRQLAEPVKLREWISEFAQDAQKQCNDARSTPDLIKAHNVFASYTFLLFLADSGHRPSTQFTFSPSAIDLESAWAIISDKITSPATRFRLIPLADILIQQLGYYETHLRNLSSRLHPESPELSARINMLAEYPKHALIPPFFLLDENLSTTPIDILSIQNNFQWPFEGNAFRHFEATGLRNESIPSEYIAILLAHVDSGQYGFSKFSGLSPAAWKEAIVPAINHMLECQGWVSIKGIKHTRQSPPDHQDQRLKLIKLKELDLFSKARSHIKESKSDREVVRASFQVAKKVTPPGSSKEEFMLAFKNEIMRQSLDAPDRIAKRLNFHVRFTRLHRHALRPSSIPGWNADLHVEDTAIEPETLLYSQYAISLRKAILHVASDFDAMNQERRMSLIVLSAILNGALLRLDLLEQLPNLLFSRLRRFDNNLWIDFPDPDSGGVQRWHPDDVTSLLIGRFIPLADTSASMSRKSLQSNIAQLLNQLDQSSNHSIESNSLKDVIRIASAFFLLHLPGLLRAFAAGEVKSSSLTEGAYLRLLSGRPMLVERSEDHRELGSIRRHRHTSSDTKIANQILGKIREVIRNEFAASASGATNRRGERRNPLAGLSKNLEAIAHAYENMPSVVFAIIAWADHMATEGTMLRKKPAIRTIYDYVSDFSAALIEFSADVDFLGLCDAELTDIYQRVIDCGNDNTRASRATSLRWFHEFCEEEFDLSEVDWDEIAPGLTRDKTTVSANFVTFNEYQIAKELVQKHQPIKRIRQMNLVALILLYRCGIRLGELLRLTVSDLILEARNILLIRNGIYGKTKSRAGIRQVPWLANLDDDESAALMDWLDHRKRVAKGDPWCALFGEEEESRTLEVRLRLSSFLTRILKVATGDPTTRIHHLRHGAGTCALTIALTADQTGAITKNAIQWFGSDSQDPSSEFREFHLGQGFPTRRIVYAISQALGHTSPRTTIWHYGHAIDLVLVDHVNKLNSLKNVQIANLAGISEGSLNVSINRSPGATAASIAKAKLLNNIKGLDPATKLADHPVSSDLLPSSEPIKWISSLKLAHAILTDLSHGYPAVQIANRYAHQENEIEAIAEAAKRLEKKTGYRTYRLVGSSGEIYDADPRLPKKDAFNKLLSGHATQFIPKLVNAIEDPRSITTLQDGLEVWLEDFETSHSGLRIAYPTDLPRMIALLNMIGIQNDQIILASNDAKKISEQLRAANIDLLHGNIEQRAACYRSSKRTSLGSIHAATLLVALRNERGGTRKAGKKAGASFPMQKLHHLFFLSALLLEYRKIYSRESDLIAE